MADDTFLSVAKEITLSVIPKVTWGGNTDPEAIGKKVGELFKVVLKEVVGGIKEANK